MNQIKLHTTISKVLDKESQFAKTDSVSSLIGTNEDAREYFFSKADENWLEWLWKNKFLDVIKEKASDPSSYSFRMPELSYLAKVAEKEPDIVTSIICSFEISAKNFNPEVIDQFTRISGKLPARCLEEVVKKMRNECWVELMGKFTQYGFEYADMLKTLQDADDDYYESMLVLAEVILRARKAEDAAEKKPTYRSSSIFYISDITQTKIFSYLVELPGKYQEPALLRLVTTLVGVVKAEDSYFLSDEDFFTLSLKTASGDSYLEEYRFLVATIIDITRKLFSDESQDKKAIYQTYFSKLPESKVARRLQLFVLSLEPLLFVAELETKYFELFATKKTLDVLRGAEYERALQAGFSFLAETQKRKFVANVFALFAKPKSEDENRWKRHYASCILSTISDELTQEEVDLAATSGFKIDSNYQPEPSIGRVRSETVTFRSPISAADFTSLTIKEIAAKLKGELSLDKLDEKYKSDDFSNRIDAEGVAEQLKEDIKNRIDKYLENAALFFDRSKLVPHYTNAYLRGIKDTLAERRTELGNLKYDDLFELLLQIKKSGISKSFSKTEEDSHGRWLSNWNSVHSTMADVLEELIKQMDKNTIINFGEYRTRMLEVLEYLLNFEDPIPEDEKIETAKSTIKHPSEPEYLISDPFTIAINSVRGRAFQALLHFVYQDGSSDKKSKLANDIKNLYLELLQKENTRAMMFMFGHYLPTFYFRDMAWMRGLFSELFESKSKDKYLQLAAWEGYLSTNLYSELFFEDYLQKLYGQNITLGLTYTKQKFFKDPSEAVAVHFALAFVHFEQFGLDNALFKTFLAKASEKQLSEFISFIGKSVITKKDSDILKDEKFSWRISRVAGLWELLLKSKANSPALKEFGAWINADNDVFKVGWLADMVARTLDATNGALVWDYGLQESIEKLALETPQVTLAILKKYFLWRIRDRENLFPIQDDKEWYNAFEILYGSTDKEIRSETHELISLLIEKGSRSFWSLEEIVGVH